jgi:hypothetical protein
MAGTAKGSTLCKVAKGDTIMIPVNTLHRVTQVDGKPVEWSLHLPLSTFRSFRLCSRAPRTRTIPAFAIASDSELFH